MVFLRICLVVFISVKLVLTFNLEPRLPLIKYGFKDSYFGYSVAQHIIPRTHLKEEEPLLLIGAPRASSGQPGTNNSGLVYRCSLTSDRRDCSPLIIDQSDKEPDPGISKDDQWMGVTVKSKARGHVIACAHRYVAKGLDYRWGLGICYSLSAFLDLEHPWEPCLNRPTGKAHEEFGFCQVGTSGEICEDNTILIGAPGPYTWRGTIFSNSVKFGIRDDKRWYMSPVRDSESPVDKYSYLGMSVASGKFFDDKLAFASGAPRSNGTGQVIFFKKDFVNAQFVAVLTLNGEQFASSFGYTIATLDCNNDNKPDFFVAAPFYYSENEGGAVYVYMNDGTGFNVNYSRKLTGKPESRFGFAMTGLGDLNHDGYNDIAIGAPYEENGGAVYIYLGSAKGIKETPSQVLRATDLPSDARITSTFGYSLSGSSDLDDNGYPDLLIGAYANDAAILIRSRPILNITTQVTGNYQKIDPNKIGCLDDIESKSTCFSFEACFRFTSESSIKSLPLKLRYRIEAETFTGKKYFRVKFNSSAETDSPNIVERNIIFKRGFDLKDEKCSREIVYVKDKSDIQSPIKFQLTYSLEQTLPGKYSEAGPIPQMSDFPILNQEEAHKVFETHFLKDCGSDNFCESDLHLTANLDLPRAPKEENKYTLYLGKGDVSLNINVSNKNEAAYDANVFIVHPESLNFRVTKKIIGEQVECIPLNGSLLRCELGNPFKAGKAEFQIRFTPKEILGDLSTIEIKVFANTTSKDKPTESLTVDLIAYVVGMAELELKGSTDQENVLYGGEVKGESAMVTEEDIGSLVTQSYIIYNRGPWRAKTVEVVISWPYEVENRKKHGKWIFYLMETPIVQDDGYCILDDYMVNPLKLKPSKARYVPLPTYKTYARKDRKENEDKVVVKPDDSNKQRKDDKSLKTEYVSSKSSEHYQSKSTYEYEYYEKSTQSVASKKVKREVVVLPEQIKEEGKVQNIVTLDCKRRTARCYQFSCFIKNLRPHHSAAIKIRARLWNSTFIEDYAYGVNQVHIISHAKLKSEPKTQTKLKFDDGIASVKTKAHPDLPLLPPQEAPLWIIILAVLLGILLLLIVIFCLWKIGFFKRKNPRTGYMPAHTDEKEINYS